MADVNINEQAKATGTAEASRAGPDHIASYEAKSPSSGRGWINVVHSPLESFAAGLSLFDLLVQVYSY